MRKKYVILLCNKIMMFLVIDKASLIVFPNILEIDTFLSTSSIKYNNFNSIIGKIDTKIEIKGNCDAGAQAWDCKCDRLWVRFPLEEMKYLIFSFPRIGNAIIKKNGGKKGTEIS